jgi:hypothetical protein
MGLFNRIFGGADGIRESMRDSYFEHVKHARSQGESDALEAHHAGLYGAFATRLMAAGRGASPPAVIAELAPFLAMPQMQGLEWLVEYVVLNERPANGRMSELGKAISDAIVRCESSDLLSAAAFAVMQGVPWRFLLRDDAKKILEVHMKRGT